MTKSERFTMKQKFLILKKDYNDIFFVEKSLSSNNSLECMYAIASCVYNDFRTPKIINLLQKLKSSTLVEWNSCKISNCAYAALDLLEIEPYTGVDLQTKELITTHFLTK